MIKLPKNQAEFDKCEKTPSISYVAFDLYQLIFHNTNFTDESDCFWYEDVKGAIRKNND